MAIEHTSEGVTAADSVEVAPKPIGYAPARSQSGVLRQTIIILCHVSKKVAP
jgi:hypothetical protein